MKRTIGRSRPAVGLLVRVALLLLSVGVVPVLHGQSAGDLASREVEFEAAFREFQGAEAAYRAARIRYDQASALVQRAEGPERAAALSRAFDLSQELQQLDRRLRGTAESLNQARRLYVEALDRRIDRLTADLAQGALPSADREGILALVQDLNNRLADLDSTPPVDDARIARLALPVLFDTRDTPDELLTKAGQLDLNADLLDRTIAVIDERIGELRARLRRNNVLRDFGANVDRFGGSRLPVGGSRPTSPSPAGGAASLPDSAGTFRLSPEEEITRLEALREDALRYRDQNRAQARQFRELAAGRRGL